MFKKLLAFIFIASGLSACAPQVRHQLSQNDLGSFAISGVTATAAPSATISWPVRDAATEAGAPANTQRAPADAVGAIEHAYRQEFKGALPGDRRVRLSVQVVNVNIMSDNQRATQIGVTAVLGGPIAMATVAATPMKVGMLANVSLIDDKTNAVLAASPITTVVSQEGRSDPGPALFRQNAIDAKKWLLTAK